MWCVVSRSRCLCNSHTHDACVRSLWTMTARKELLKKKPSLGFKEVGSELGALWKKVSDADKASWKEGGAKYKAAHKGK